MSEEKRVGNAEDQCSSCNRKNEACISFFAHENAMMHKDMDNERANRSNMIFAITVLVLVVIFVITYTVRMNAFINVIKEMNADLVKLASAKVVAAP